MQLCWACEYLVSYFKCKVLQLSVSVLLFVPLEIVLDELYVMEYVV